MAEHFFAEIDIPAAALEDKEIREKVAGLGWGGKADGIATFYDEEARWGMFEELEALLIEKGIPFDRRSAGFADYDPEIRYFRPARNGQPAFDRTYQGAERMEGPLLNVWDVCRRLKDLGQEAFLTRLEEKYPEPVPLQQWLAEDVRQEE